MRRVPEGAAALLDVGANGFRWFAGFVARAYACPGIAQAWLARRLPVLERSVPARRSAGSQTSFFGSAPMTMVR